MKDKKQKGELKIEVLLEYANSIIATLREPFLVLDKNLRVISANQAFYTIFEVTEKDIMGRPLPDLGNRQWDIPKLLQLLKEIIPEKKVVKDYEVEHKFKLIGERIMRLNARHLRVPKQVASIITAGVREEEEELILLAIEDITERKRLQEELKASEDRYRRAFETSRAGLLLVHKTEANILNSNASAQELLGYSQEEFLKKKLWEIGVTKNDLDFQEVVSILERDGVIRYEDILVKTKQGLSVNTEVFLVDKAKVIQCNIRDITERKQAEKELMQLKEQQYKTLIENLSGKVFLKDMNSVYISCNENYARDLKIKADEIKGKTDYDFYPKKLAEKYRADDKKVMEKGEIADIEEKHIKDGKEYFVQTVKTPVKDGRGNVIGLLGIFWDITERKKMEEKIKVFSDAIADALDCFMLTDAMGNITYANESALGAFGYTLKEFLKLNINELDADPKAAKKVMQEMTVKGKWSGEVINIRKNRETFPSLLSAFIIKDDKGNPKGAMGILRDITARKRAEEKLRESEERYRLLIQTLPHIVYEIDVEGRFIFVSDGVKQLGYTSEELIGKHFKEIVHPDDFEAVSRFIVLPKYRGRITGAENSPRLFDERRTNGRMTQHLQIRLLRKSQNETQGDYCYCEIDSSGGWDRPVEDKDKNFLGSIGIIHDVTKRKQLEEAEHEHIRELETFYKASIGREERIIELKKEIEMLKKGLGK